MTPEQRLRLVQQELKRFVGDDRAAPVREAVFVDRLGWIIGLDAQDRRV